MDRATTGFESILSKVHFLFFLLVPTQQLLGYLMMIGYHSTLNTLIWLNMIFCDHNERLNYLIHISAYHTRNRLNLIHTSIYIVRSHIGWG